jgi:Mce-associated membrane protein
VISCLSVHDPEGPDIGRSDDPADVTDLDDSQSDSGVTPAASETDTTDEVAEAEARAAAARARLESLRRAAEIDDADASRKRLRLPRRPGRPQWLRRPGRKPVAVIAGTVVFLASLGATGYMLWQHHTEAHNRQLATEFSSAARQGVTALMSINPDHAKEDVQRMIDASTGDLNAELSAMSVLIVMKAQETKVGSKVNVEAVAVESLSDNSGVVLVAAKTDATGPDNAKPPPALFRLSVKLDRDGGRLKMSKVDYLS